MKRKSAVMALAVGFLTAASVQAVPITYKYTGNQFTSATSPYTTSDSVSGMLTLATPLAPNTMNSIVTPTSFSFFDGVQTITDTNASDSVFLFGTDPTGMITQWQIQVIDPLGEISTGRITGGVGDLGFQVGSGAEGSNTGMPGVWTTVSTPVADTGSSLTMMTLTLMALGVAARQFKRAAA